MDLESFYRKCKKLERRSLLEKRLYWIAHYSWSRIRQKIKMYEENRHEKHSRPS